MWQSPDSPVISSAVAVVLYRWWNNFDIFLSLAYIHMVFSAIASVCVVCGLWSVFGSFWSHLVCIGRFLRSVVPPPRVLPGSAVEGGGWEGEGWEESTDWASFLVCSRLVIYSNITMIEKNYKQSEYYNKLLVSTLHQKTSMCSQFAIIYIPPCLWS